MQKTTSRCRFKLHRFALSGHCHRVELFLSILKLPAELKDIDLSTNAQKAPSFLALNPFGQVPVLQDGDITVIDSNAILVYLALKYAPAKWLPHDPILQASVQHWLSVAAGQLAFGPARARAIHLFKAPFNMVEATQCAENLFTNMERVLEKSAYLVGEEPTLADIANYSYVAHAPEGLISLAPYPAIKAWLTRIEQLPGFIPMARNNV
jgi:glutathione S-transferase